MSDSSNPPPAPMADVLAQALNQLLKRYPVTIAQLFDTRVTLPPEEASSPLPPAGEPTLVISVDHPGTVSVLGLLNGILCRRGLSGHRIAAIYRADGDGPPEKLAGFGARHQDHPRCCFLYDTNTPIGHDAAQCPNRATHRLEHGVDRDAYTEVCEEHVTAMLTDAVEHRLYRLP